MCHGVDWVGLYVRHPQAALPSPVAPDPGDLEGVAALRPFLPPIACPMAGAVSDAEDLDRSEPFYTALQGKGQPYAE